ncbi:unnamed protein product, partial [marine sediment metagenome]
MLGDQSATVALEGGPEEEGEKEDNQGDIGSVQGTIQFYSTGWKPRIVHVSGNIYAIAYRGPGSIGGLTTVSISDDGLTLSVKASLEFYAYATGAKIIHISGNIYAIAYQSYDEKGWLTTVSISDDGLTLSVKASLQFGVARTSKVSFAHISGNVYAIACRGADYDGWLTTVSISDDGLTLALTGASLEFDTSECWDIEQISHISGNVYAIAYGQTSGGLGLLKTLSISDDGLTLSVKAS